MTERLAVVLARPPSAALAPPGIDGDVYATALLEDTYEVLAGLAHCATAVVACPPSYGEAARAVVWPGTPVLTVEVPDGGLPVAAIEAVAALGAADLVVVAGDAPDLPGLMVGKLFSALTGASVAVCPAADGGLVALGVRLPVPDWLRAAAVDLDAPDALASLQAAAPQSRAIVVTPGWHRIRQPLDVTRLDPGLEGWAATRALLAGH